MNASFGRRESEMKRKSKRQKAKARGGESESESQSQSGDPFGRLPDEVVILIFTKLELPDFRFLCQCLLVSKRFASTIPHIPTVSITIPSPDFPPECLTPETILCLSSQIAEIRSVADSLRKFKEIRSLYVEFASDAEEEESSSSLLLNWKAKFGTELEGIAILSSTSMSKFRDNDDDDDDGADGERLGISIDELQSRLDLGFKCLVEGFLWYHILLLLIDHQTTTIQSVLITDSKKQGKMCYRGKQLVELQSNWANASTALTDTGSGRKIPGNVSVGYVPVLRLPLSGYVMKGVTVFVSQTGVGQMLDHDDDGDKIVWDFEEKVFGEAVTSILMNHKDKLHLLK